MKVGVLCEFSEVVRDAFLAKGHDAISCDLLPTERPGPHIQGDCLAHDWSDYDLLICHPPCTYLCNTGVQWLHKDPTRWGRMEKAASFFSLLWDLPVPKICIENPVPHKYANLPPYSQTIQPFQFGHRNSKRTCLWLKGLPHLKPTRVVDPDMQVLRSGRKIDRTYSNTPKKDRGKLRSTTYQGIADAMASQWNFK